jgi:hypothetical protein
MMTEYQIKSMEKIYQLVESIPELNETTVIAVAKRASDLMEVKTKLENGCGFCEGGTPNFLVTPPLYVS